MAGSVGQIGPSTNETLGGFFGLYPVPPYYSVMPGPAIGPMLGANSAAVPLSTLPAGVGAMQPAATGSKRMSTRGVTIGLAVSFVLGVLILQFVHWR